MLAGFATADISVWEPGLTIMGWGRPDQQVEGVDVPLHARAMVVIDDEGTCWAHVVVDLMAVTQGLWHGVVDRLAALHPEVAIGAAHLTLAATHTHSGPSGYSHHFWMHLNAPGFSRPVYDRIRDGVVDAIVRAHAQARPRTLRVAAGEVPREAKVAFNRSWFAYSRNVDTPAVPQARWDEAVHRTLTVLHAAEEGRLAGLASWFGTHGTTVHASNRHLHPDHKGLASLAFEAEGAVALMAQECCGDVSPNHRPSRRGHTIGAHDDDRQSAAHVAQVQVDVIRRLVVDEGVAVEGPVAIRVGFVDFRHAPVDPRWSPDGKAHTTSSPRLGMPMAEGTAEGPGPLRPVRAANRAVTGMRRSLARLGLGSRHDPKWTLLDFGQGDQSRVAGLVPVRHLPAVDEVLGWVRDRVREGSAGSDPWMPCVLPVQVVRLGSLLVCAVPFEVTTVAGRRLRETLRQCAPEGVEHVVVETYANAYVGYLTTYEEYQVQHYEAAYNLFGPFALGALRTAVAGLCRDLAEGGVAMVGEPPAPVPDEVLERVGFARPWGR